VSGPETGKNQKQVFFFSFSDGNQSTLFEVFEHRSSQDKANKNSLHQDEVGGGYLQ
jgi:hypothetical protein